MPDIASAVTDAVAATDDLPKYQELMLPTLLAIKRLGGSAKARQITESVIEELGPPDELLALTYPERDKSMYLDRLDWARSYCSLGASWRVRSAASS
ncbi:MAG: hypothetical protein OXN44_06075 [Acidimicrobiaceae bacterium]|nr:hypothetical protein [Acidimicrobiaceae bacterium]MDE0606388.1 hypothetical protein [Acidimicrobiaceae bacterium]